MGKAFRNLQNRRGARGTVVGVHTMMSCTISLMAELMKFLQENTNPELQDKLQPVLEEARNFEEAAVTYLKGGH